MVRVAVIVFVLSAAIFSIVLAWPVMFSASSPTETAAETAVETPAETDPAAEVDSTREANQSAGGSPYLLPVLVLLLLALVVSFASMAVAVRLLYWSRYLEGGQRSVVPNALLNQWDVLVGELAKYADESKQAEAQNHDVARSTDEKIETIREALAIFTDGLNKKDVEIDRLRKGGETYAFRRFLRRFIKLHAALSDDIDDARAAGGNVAQLEGLMGLLEDALYESGAEKFVPNVGAPYQSEFGVADAPRVTATDVRDHDGLIESVARPGFRSLDGAQVYEPAKVTVYQLSSES